MTVTDPIAEMLTRIRNANQAGKERVDIPSSKMKQEIARILKEEGYIKNYRVISDRRQGILRIYLKYTSKKEKVISEIKRISKPSLKQYVKGNEVTRVLGGLGVAILSTSQGIMTDKKARKKRIGGEVICHVW
ncbi:30S ribosomal protein S8 [bacterium]|nr:30S ribosomal protein S8 [bacterium]MBU4561690.1 30S ribosomal protein S8 [bacterium]MCG2675628.1 30S ribosomal protein S8 [bacterium]MCG2677766.1 30S ribosomal protein S8 [bacterium]